MPWCYAASVRTSRQMQHAAGQTIGGFSLVRQLGTGAMGEVWRASRGEENVALKVMHPVLAHDVAFRARFLREARIAREIAHPHLVPVVAAGDDAGTLFLASRLIPGGTLDQHLREGGPLQPDELSGTIDQLASALDAVHRAGLVHRDVKPANVLLDDGGSALLADFGLATGPALTVLTKPGQVVGTPHYLAPELVRGEEAQAASDVYSLGCLAYALLTGAPPFVGGGSFRVLAAHLGDPPPDPVASRPELSRRFALALLTALAKRPEDRPHGAIAYALGLRRALSA